MEISYADRLKAIYDKEQALSNAILSADHSKLNSLLKTQPEILTEKHVRLNELLKDSSTTELLAKRNDITEELNYSSLINSSKYYTERNGLHIGNPTDNLKAELDSKDPSHKEPIIHHIVNGADLKLITKENIEQKLNDISIKDFAGYKIAETDQIEIVKFATIHAIKTNNIEALKSLEKEFSISKDIYLSKEFIQNNSNSQVLQYSNEIGLSSLKENNNQSIVSELRLQQLYENRKLEIALSRGEVESVKEAIIKGADEKLVNEKSIRSLDPKDQIGIMIAVKEAKDIRMNNLPKEARFEIKDNQNEILKNAIINNDALKASNAIKNGADISTLKKDDFKHLNPIEEKLLKIELSKALNVNAQNHSKEINTGLGKKL